MVIKYLLIKLSGEGSFHALMLLHIASNIRLGTEGFLSTNTLAEQPQMLFRYLGLKP
jgi:hypothetical protein